jgi:IS1 family transposase
VPAIDSKPSKLRLRMKRLVRRTRCFAQTAHLHDLVIEWFSNR